MAKKHKKESFSKKSAKKFGGYIKSPYLCTRKSEIDRCSNTASRIKRSQGGSVAQLNRASDYGSEGCGFESRRNHKKQGNSEQSFTLARYFFALSCGVMYII